MTMWSNIGCPWYKLSAADPMIYKQRERLPKTRVDGAIVPRAEPVGNLDARSGDIHHATTHARIHIFYSQIKLFATLLYS